MSKLSRRADNGVPGGVATKPAWEVYIVETRSGNLYTGISTDVERRLAQHYGKTTGGAKFFRLSPPRRLLYRAPCGDRGAALLRERQIKAMSRQQKLALIASARRPRRRK